MTLAEGIERDIAGVAAQLPAAERLAERAATLILDIEKQIVAQDDLRKRLDEMLRCQKLIAARPANLRNYIERARGGIDRSKLAAQSANFTDEISH